MSITWSYSIPDLDEEFVVQADDLATIVELRSAVLTLASRLAHNEAHLLEHDDTVRCEMCETWVATHTVTIGDITYHICDKPRCQDRATTLVQQQTETEQVVVGLTRQDLRDAGFTDEQIVDITDKDMKRIASRLGDAIKGDEWEQQMYEATTMVLEWNEPLVTEAQ